MQPCSKDRKDTFLTKDGPLFKLKDGVTIYPDNPIMLVGLQDLKVKVLPPSLFFSLSSILFPSLTQSLSLTHSFSHTIFLSHTQSLIHSFSHILLLLYTFSPTNTLSFIHTRSFSAYLSLSYLTLCKGSSEVVADPPDCRPTPCSTRNSNTFLIHIHKASSFSSSQLDLYTGCLRNYRESVL